jgi:hypothetical protein
MAIFPATTACGKWSTRRAATCWRAWRWCRAPWKRGAWTRFRPARQAGAGGDLAAAAILDIILRDEVGHVEIGNRWYGYLCDQRGLELRATYAELARRYEAPTLRGPFNLEARRRAGFSELELADLPS